MNKLKDGQEGDIFPYSWIPGINVKGMMEIKNHHNNDHLAKYHQSILKLGMGTRWADKQDF